VENIVARKNIGYKFVIHFSPTLLPSLVHLTYTVEERWTFTHQNILFFLRMFKRMHLCFVTFISRLKLCIMLNKFYILNFLKYNNFAVHFLKSGPSLPHLPYISSKDLDYFTVKERFLMFFFNSREICKFKHIRS
jgi:hypothetical protein